MKSKKKIEEPQIKLPRENAVFIGHNEAVAALYSAYVNNNMPGAWLISGPKGIGKATLAHRFARFVLYNGSGSSGGLFGNSSPDPTLAIPEASPTFAKTSIGSHPDMLVLEQGENSGILVDEARKIGSFLHLTSAETPYRIIVIDSIDDMNANAANAILKLLEEPPAKAMFILVSHSPGKLLPTIRSRCRHIKMRGLEEADALNVLYKISPEITPGDSRKLISLASGSPGVAYGFSINNGMELYQNIVDILQKLPALDILAVQKFGDSLSGKANDAKWEVSRIILNKIITDCVREQVHNNATVNNNLKLSIALNIEELVEAWQDINNLMDETDNIHLDRKAVLFRIFSMMNGKG